MSSRIMMMLAASLALLAQPVLAASGDGWFESMMYHAHDLWNRLTNPPDRGNLRYQDAMAFCVESKTCPLLAPPGTTKLNRSLEDKFAESVKKMLANPSDKNVSEEAKALLKDANFGLTAEESSLLSKRRASYGGVSDLLAAGLMETVRRVGVLQSGVDMDGLGLGTLWRVERSGVWMGDTARGNCLETDKNCLGGPDEKILNIIEDLPVGAAKDSAEGHPHLVKDSAKDPHPAEQDHLVSKDSADSFLDNAPAKNPSASGLEIVSTPPIAVLEEEVGQCRGIYDLEACLSPPEQEIAEELFPAEGYMDHYVPALCSEKLKKLRAAIDPEVGFVTCTTKNDCFDVYSASVKKEQAGQYECRTLFGEYNICVPPTKEFWAKRVGAILQQHYELMVSAEYSVDFTQLDVPDGFWLRFFQKSLSKLNAKKTPMAIRVLVGLPADSTLHDPAKIADKLLSGNLLSYKNLDLRVAYYRSGLVNFNHSKTLIVDRARMMTGGINVYHTHYFLKRPVVDIDVLTTGPGTAEGVLAWNDLMWARMAYENHERSSNLIVTYEPWNSRYVWPEDALKRPFDQTAPERVGQEGHFAPVLRLSRPSWDQGKAFSNTFIPAMLAQAKSSISIAQQDLISAFPVSWPQETLQAIASAKVRNPDLRVRILVSRPWFSPAEDDPYLAASTGNIYGWHPFFGSREKLSKALCAAYDTEKKKMDAEVVEEITKPGGGTSTEGAAAQESSERGDRPPTGGGGRSPRSEDSCAELFQVNYMFNTLQKTMKDDAAVKTIREKPKEKETFLGGVLRTGWNFLVGSSGWDREDIDEAKELFDTAWGMHTKFYAIDDQVVSVGSHNMYHCELDEEQNVYDDAEIAKKIMVNFYDRIWQLSNDP